MPVILFCIPSIVYAEDELSHLWHILAPSIYLPLPNLSPHLGYHNMAQAPDKQALGKLALALGMRELDTPVQAADTLAQVLDRQAPDTWVYVYFPQCHQPDSRE